MLSGVDNNRAVRYILDVAVKKATSFRLTSESMDLLKLMADQLGISQSAALEMAIRDVAEQRRIKETREAIYEAVCRRKEIAASGGRAKRKAR